MCLFLRPSGSFVGLVHITDKRGTKLRPSSFVAHLNLGQNTSKKSVVNITWFSLLRALTSKKTKEQCTTLYREFLVILVCQYLPSSIAWTERFTHIRMRGRSLQISICPTKVTFVSGSFNSVYTNVSSTCHFIIGSFERTKGISLKYPLFPLKPCNRLPRNRIAVYISHSIYCRGRKSNSWGWHFEAICTTKLSFFAKEICATIIQVTSEYMCVEMIVVSVG